MFVFSCHDPLSNWVTVEATCELAPPESFHKGLVDLTFHADWNIFPGLTKRSDEFCVYERAHIYFNAT